MIATEFWTGSAVSVSTTIEIVTLSQKAGDRIVKMALQPFLCNADITDIIIEQGVQGWSSIITLRLVCGSCKNQAIED